jgi:hypothetical protein
VYSGGIIRAGADYNMSRDRPFIINSLQYFTLQNTNILPTNIQGSISVDNLFRYIANKAGFRYVGTDVSGNAYNPILTGSVLQQLDEVSKRYGYKHYISQDSVVNQNVVFVSPINTPFDIDTYQISAENNNMIGFPVITDYGFSVMSYFNPQLTVGRSVNVNSLTVPYINNRTLYVNQMVHELGNRSNNWRTTMQLNIWSGIFTQ